MTKAEVRRARRAALLKEARKLVETRWTQGVMARDEYGDEVDPESDEAASFCAVGAVYHVAVNRRQGFSLAKWLDRSVRTLYPRDGGIHIVNDSRATNRAVLRVFDHAIHQITGEKP